MALRTSTEASNTITDVDCFLPSRRNWRRRLTTFSTSTMASSTTAPIAITKPAKTITLSEVPRNDKTSSVMTAVTGMIVALIKAIRQSHKKAMRTTTTRNAPMSSELMRLSKATSTKVAGRKMVVSMSMSRSPGAISSMAASTPCVTSTVLAHGNFSTIKSKPGPSFTTASPIIGQVSSTISATSPSLRGVPSLCTLSLMGTFARSTGEITGSTCWIGSRWFGVSRKPPVPTMAPSEYSTSPTSRVSETTCTISSTGTRCSANRSGST